MPRVNTVLVGCFVAGAAAINNNLRGDAQQVRVLSELGAAEHMMQEELRGAPTVLKEEMQLLHSAENAIHGAPHVPHRAIHGTALTQQKVQEGIGGSLMGELNSAKLAIEQALKGHPKVLQEEEAALKQAEDAAQHMSAPRASFVETATKQTAKSAAKAELSLSALQELRSRSMAKAMQEEHSYATAEENLAKDGSKVLAEFSQIKDAVAEAFAGKDSKAIKEAMKVGALMDTAEEKQKEEVKSSADEAARAKKDVAVQAAAFAQLNARSKAAQEQQAYTAGMNNLVVDGKNILSEFATVKGAVAQAFAGKDSKAVEKAMEVGELLDQARQEQQQVTDRDQKESASVTKLFGKLPIY